MTILRLTRNIQRTSGASNSPALGQSGWTDNGDGATATAATVIFDLRDSNFNSYSAFKTAAGPTATQTMVRAGSAEYVSGGGYYGQGCWKMIPGYFTDPGDSLGQHKLGVANIGDLNSIAGGECKQLSIGLLTRMGPTWITEPLGNKTIIVNRGGGQTTRPMVIPKEVNVATNQVLGACDGTVCEFNGNGPNQIDLAELYQFVVFEVDIDANAGAGRLTTRLWDQGGTFTGSGASVMERTMAEGAGGNLPTIDIISAFVNSVVSPTADCWMENEYIEIWIGTASGMTPPKGYPGSAR